MALSTSPDALRVATPFSSAAKVGSASAQPSGRRRGSAAGRAARRRSAACAAHAAYSSSHARLRGLAALDGLRVWARTSSGTSKVCSGSKPRIFLVAATSSSPSAEPWALPVFCAFGAGQAMIVRSR